MAQVYRAQHNILIAGVQILDTKYLDTTKRRG